MREVEVLAAFEDEGDKRAEVKDAKVEEFGLFPIVSPVLSMNADHKNDVDRGNGDQMPCMSQAAQRECQRWNEEVVEELDWYGPQEATTRL